MKNKHIQWKPLDITENVMRVDFKIEKSNFVMEIGNPSILSLSFFVKKTILNRIRYWIFFMFSPFKLVSWEKEDYGRK